MRTNRCAAKCSRYQGVSRRSFLAATSTSLMTAAGVGEWFSRSGAAVAGIIKPKGPGADCVPTVKCCFVRRKGEYGMRWPGQVFDGKAALKKYTQQIKATAKQLNTNLDLRPQPLHGMDESEAWIKEVTDAKPDGLLVVLLDRQEHAWPTANMAVDTKIPTVIFSPVGSSFTINTAEPSKKPGCFICSTDDFRQVQYGLKMLHAGAKMRATRCLVLRGTKTADTEMPHLGIKLRYVPARTFLDEYQNTPVDDEVLKMAKELIGGAKRMAGPTEQDVINGIKSYVVAAKLLQREQADAITMDCLGALGKSEVSLPCIAWSVMNDHAVPAACEADLGAVASHILVQYLFDRPGFQQDPVAETVREAIIGAHCACATKLNGFDKPPEPYDILPHHGLRDATRRTIWKVGQRITSADVLPGRENTPTKMLISSGAVLENVSVPPAGGCVVSVMVKFDGVSDVLAYPGFHQIFFYGDFKRELAQFCQLFGIQPVIV